MNESTVLLALGLVLAGGFIMGRLYEIVMSQRRVTNERMHNIVAGSHYILSRSYRNPFDDDIKVQVLCVKEGWVQYKYTDAMGMRPDSKTVRDFCAIYQPAVNA